MNEKTAAAIGKNVYSPEIYRTLLEKYGAGSASVVMNLSGEPVSSAAVLAPLVRKLIAVDTLGKNAMEKTAANVEAYSMPADQLATIGKMVNMIIVDENCNCDNPSKICELAYRILLPGGSMVVPTVAISGWEKLLGEAGFKTAAVGTGLLAGIK